ncbi:MAG: helix-turn-helix transcriptional regulator [Nitrososphaera sp.]
MVKKDSLNERRLSKNLARAKWDTLTFRQKETRLRGLEALGLMRKGKSLTVAANETGISPSTFKRHIGKPLEKRRGRWKAKSHDRISRVMTIFSNGRRYNIETRSSTAASIIGRYNSAVGHFTQTGHTTNLNKMKGTVVRDASGQKYILETRPKKVIAILERLEEPDIPTIYAI